MEYVQERVATLHDLTGAVPTAPLDRTAAIVPMTDREYASLSAERVLEELARVGVRRAYLPIRTDRTAIGPVLAWLRGFDLPTTPIWCDGPALAGLLDDAGLDDPRGKGRDVWLAMGLAAAVDGQELLVLHDADARSYSGDLVRKLCWPLANGFDFAKGYYARLERGRLYGRLFRLFVVPLLRALEAGHDHPLLDYLGAFRYALAGEMAMTGEVALSMRAHPTWGFEMGALGEAHRLVGFEGSAQVDLGVHEHDHRSVDGPAGLAEMCESVNDATFLALGDVGLEPDPASVRRGYREAASRLIAQYAADAAVNDLEYDPEEERAQVEAYAGAIRRPPADPRLPAWRDRPIHGEGLRTAVERDLETARGG